MDERKVYILNDLLRRKQTHDYCGIKEVKFIPMGSRNEPLLSYKGYAVSENFVADEMWEHFAEDGEGFNDFYFYIQAHKDEVFRLLDNAIINARMKAICA